MNMGKRYTHKTVSFNGTIEDYHSSLKEAKYFTDCMRGAGHKNVKLIRLSDGREIYKEKE